MFVLLHQVEQVGVAMKQGTVQINSNTFLKLGIDPKEAIDYLERKKAVTLSPAHVIGLQILKQQTVSSS